MFAAVLATLLFSFSVVFGHRSATVLGGTEANFWRLCVAGFFLGSWALTGGGGIENPTLPLFVISGLAGIGLGDVAFFQALPRLGSRLTSLIVQCLVAPLAALMEWLWMGTLLSAGQAGCGALILSGLGVALAPGKTSETARPRFLSGLAFASVAAVGGALGAVLSRKAYALAALGGGVPDGGTAAFQRVLGGLAVSGLAVLAVKAHRLTPADRRLSAETVARSRAKWRRAWPWVLLNSTAGMTLGVSCMQVALETTPAGLVMAIVALTPIAVIPLACIFEKEQPSTRSVLGGLIAVLGAVGLALL